MWSAFACFGGLIAAAVARPRLADSSAAFGIGLLGVLLVVGAPVPTRLDVMLGMVVVAEVAVVVVPGADVALPDES